MHREVQDLPPWGLRPDAPETQHRIDDPFTFRRPDFRKETQPRWVRIRGGWFGPGLDKTPDENEKGKRPYRGVVLFSGGGSPSVESEPTFLG